MPDNKRKFLKKLQKLSRSRSPHRTFSDWLEVAAIAMHQLPYQSGELEIDADFEKLEQKYLDRIKSYGKDELIVFSELLAITLSEHSLGPCDFLGEIAGEAELLNKGSGQIFTPYHLCRAMAKMTFGNVQQSVVEKGIITVGEPAVGAGALVIASAEEIADQGVDPRACVQFDCTDISRDACNMAYIQLSAQNLQAVVRHGNTLGMEYWESRPTSQLRLFHQWLERRQRSEPLVQAVQLLFSVAITPSAECPLSLSGSEEVAEKREQLKRCPPKPDIILDRQLELFGSN